MADFFLSEGVPAVAVHSGPNSAPRATSLERLKLGELTVVFAVDIFNEGVDVPAIDTVLMLRPTESTILWLQQLGRGLRVAPDKNHLTVIDYIGNHRAFLTKLRALALVADREAASIGRQREVLEAIVSNRLILPPGCEVTYDLAAVDILKELLRPTRSEDLLESFYRDFESRHATRPTAIEAFHAGLDPRGNSDRSWLGFVERMRGFDSLEAAAWQNSRAFFERLEVTPTVRSYKVVLLLAMLDGDLVIPRLSIDEVTRRVAVLVKRMHRLADDFSVDPADVAALQALLVRNPIDAFVKGDGMGGFPYFVFDGREFAFNLEIGSPDAFGRLLREILDWRLGQYLARGEAEWNGDILCRVVLNSSGDPILSLPQATSPSLPEGTLNIEVEGEALEVRVTKVAIDVARRPGDGINRLSDLLHDWFGDTAGAPGRGNRVRIRNQHGRTTMEPIGVVSRHTSGLTLWERYLRDAIPPAFGLPFSKAIWNVGFVVRDPNIFLLVSLEKAGANPNHQYVDHFTTDRDFSWQSQNRTTQASTHGVMLRDHAAKALHVHLLVRPGRRGPFIYCGEVDFVAWQGNAPISVHWRLREAVPQSLWATLQVPSP